MKYLIDTVVEEEIDLALSIGFAGITANPSMYKNNNTSVCEYLQINKDKSDFITAEVVGSLEEMQEEVRKLVTIDPKVIIKLNFGIEELKLAKWLKSKNITFAFTLIFTKQQALIAMQSGAKYLFYFFARNEETGANPYEVCQQISDIIKESNSDCQLVGASIRNIYHLNEATQLCDLVCIPFKLIDSQFSVAQTLEGKEKFENDFIFA